MSKLKIRGATSIEDVNFVMEWVKKRRDGAYIGKADMELFYATEPQGFYIGELDGDKVSHISIVKYGENEICVIGHYYVKPEHQKRGYGLQIWNYTWSKVAKNCKVIYLTCPKDSESMYRKYGFETAWFDYMCKFTSKNAISLPLPQECSSLIFASYRNADFDSLLAYDTSVFGYPRRSFLKKLVTVQEFVGWVASNKSSEIVGYCTLRKSVDESCWLLSPWYANDTFIAQALLNKAADFALSQPGGESSCLSIVVPEVNEDAIHLVKSLCPVEKGYPRMYVGSVPRDIQENCKRRIFGISSPSIG